MIDELAEFIEDGLRSQYEDPVEGAGYDSREGGYQVPTQETDDLLWEHELTENSDLIMDLTRLIENGLWCNIDPYAATPTESLEWGWRRFKELVSTERRYTFLTRTPHPPLEAATSRWTRCRPPSSTLSPRPSEPSRSPPGPSGGEPGCTSQARPSRVRSTSAHHSTPSQPTTG